MYVEMNPGTREVLSIPSELSVNWQRVGLAKQNEEDRWSAGSRISS